MKRSHLTLAWLISVIAGSTSIGLFLGEIELVLVFGAISAGLSIPYLILMLLLNKRKRPFLHVQLIHFGLAFLTVLVITLIAFGGGSARELPQLLMVVSTYFVFGVITQALFYYKQPQVVEVKHAMDLLDDF